MMSSHTIRIALEKTVEENPGKTKLAESSLKIALATTRVNSALFFGLQVLFLN